MENPHQAGARFGAFPDQETVPGQEFGEKSLCPPDRRGRCRIVLPARRTDGMQCGDGMHGRLADATSEGGGRGVGTDLGRGPSVRPGEIALGVRVEHDVRHHAVAPLAGKQGIEVAVGEVDVEGGQPDGDERRIPAPLVRVQAPRRFDNVPVRIEAENVSRSSRHRRRQLLGELTSVIV